MHNPFDTNNCNGTIIKNTLLYYTVHMWAPAPWYIYNNYQRQRIHLKNIQLYYTANMLYNKYQRVTIHKIEICTTAPPVAPWYISQIQNKNTKYKIKIIKIIKILNSNNITKSKIIKILDTNNITNSKNKTA